MHAHTQEHHLTLPGTEDSVEEELGATAGSNSCELWASPPKQNLSASLHCLNPGLPLLELIATAHTTGAIETKRKEGTNVGRGGYQAPALYRLGIVLSSLNFELLNLTGFIERNGCLSIDHMEAN